MNLSKEKKEKLRRECTNELKDLLNVISKRRFEIDNGLATRQRTLQRNTYIYLDAIPKFYKKDCKKTITVRYNSMYSNISQFGLYLEIYYNSSTFFKRFILHRILGRKRLYAIIDSIKEKNEKDYVTINEVFSLFKWLNLKKDFMNYLQSKTQFSYSITPYNEIKAITNKLFYYTTKQATKIKFAQFVYVILSEYILLHNLMFVSGYKIDKIKSIDTWIEDL